MKAIICYYSGSGNTKLACQYIAAHLNGADVDLFDIIRDGLPALERYDLVGFATFTDFWDPSQLVRAFLDRLPGQRDRPAFVFCTYGSMPGSTLRTLADWVTAKGFRVVAAHGLHTPENYPPIIARGLTAANAPGAKELQAFRDFVSSLGDIAARIGRGEPVRTAKVKTPLLARFIKLPRTKARSDMGAKLVDEATCTECGLCAKRCPSGAITLSPKPVFDEGKCQGCWACYNHCPTMAIYTEKLRGKGLYARPNEQLKDKLAPSGPQD